MSDSELLSGAALAAAGLESDKDQFVTVSIAGQVFGIPVLTVHDVLTTQRVTPIPLAPPEVAGALNLRGRIVTAINVRQALGLPAIEDESSNMYVVVENNDDLYSLVVDKVGEVMDLPSSAFEDTPTTLDRHWRAVAGGIYRLDGELLVLLDVARLLDFEQTQAA